MLETRRRTPRKSNPSPKEIKIKSTEDMIEKAKPILDHPRSTISRRRRTGRRRQREPFSILSIFIILLTICLCVVALMDVMTKYKTKEIIELPEYVSLAEYHAIDKGMTHQQVKNIIGNYGQLRFKTIYHGSKFEIFDWFAFNSTTANVRIVFENNHVAAKKKMSLD